MWLAGQRETTLSSNSVPMKRLISLGRLYTKLSSPVAFIARRFVREAGRTFGRRCLVCVDIGAGTAPYRAEVCEAFGVNDYFTIDIAPPDLTSVAADACALPLHSESVDLVVSFDVIQHIIDPEGAMREVGRVLRPGGCAVITFPFLYAE